MFAENRHCFQSIFQLFRSSKLFGEIDEGGGGCSACAFRANRPVPGPAAELDVGFSLWWFLSSSRCLSASGKKGERSVLVFSAPAAFPSPPFCQTALSLSCFLVAQTKVNSIPLVFSFGRSDYTTILPGYLAIDRPASLFSSTAIDAPSDVSRTSEPCL